MMKVADLYPKDHNVQIFTDASNKGWGVHLAQISTKVCGQTGDINVLVLKAVLVATDNSTVVAYTNKQGRTHSAEMFADLVPLLPDKSSQAHANVPKCDGRPTV